MLGGLLLIIRFLLLYVIPGKMCPIDWHFGFGRRLPLVDGAVAAVAGVADGLLEPLDHVVVGVVEGDRPARKDEDREIERDAARVIQKSESKVITVTGRIRGNCSDWRDQLCRGSQTDVRVRRRDGGKIQ